MYNVVETIAAIATPKGQGGIGIMRVSGPRAKEISYQVTAKQLKPRVATHSVFLGENQQPLDEGIALFFLKEKKSHNEFRYSLLRYRLTFF